ncbi:MAG: cell division protein FtsL [Acidobacteriota bacterium]|nr:cell division protein FtsL [Acidobacteriota bacterium]
MVRKKYSWRQIILVACLVIFFLGNLTFYIWYQSESIRLGYKIHDLENQAEKLKEEIKQLEARKESLLSLDRIDRLARSELNLQEIKPDQIVFEDQTEK